MDVEMIRSKITSLKAALDEQLPGMKTMLADIHRHLREEPDVVTALSEEEISTIVLGLKQHANIEITATKKPGSGSKRKISASDL